MLAEKLLEHEISDFGSMIRILSESLRPMVTRSKLINLESTIIRTLDFDLMIDGPIPFLMRFLRILELDIDSSETIHCALNLILHMQKNEVFLNFKPSVLAANALIAAISTNHAKK